MRTDDILTRLLFTYKIIHIGAPYVVKIWQILGQQLYRRIMYVLVLKAIEDPDCISLDVILFIR